MAKRLYVGNLSYDLTGADLMRIFSEFGAVDNADVVMDSMTGRSKGFGFVQMAGDEEAQAAIQVLNGKEVEGRILTVNEAKPRGGGGGGRWPR